MELESRGVLAFFCADTWSLFPMGEGVMFPISEILNAVWRVPLTVGGGKGGESLCCCVLEVVSWVDMVRVSAITTTRFVANAVVEVPSSDTGRPPLS